MRQSMNEHDRDFNAPTSEVVYVYQVRNFKSAPIVLLIFIIVN